MRLTPFSRIFPNSNFYGKTSLREFEGENGIHIRTIKLRGQVSQGLAFPLKSFPDIPHGLGSDVTANIGVKKFEKPLPKELLDSAIGYLPSTIHKTDLERVQNIWEDVKMTWNPYQFEVTVKLDGEAVTVFSEEGGTVRVCSRNVMLKDTGNNVAWEAARNHGIIEEVQEAYRKGHRFAIQGELMGPGIRGNKERLRLHRIFIYGVWDINRHRYLTSAERKGMLSYHGLYEQQVPHITETTLEPFDTVEDMLKFADGESLHAERREGIVFKSVEPINNGSLVQFKVINNNFLLKHQE